jgi:hypothetical protein
MMMMTWTPAARLMFLMKTSHNALKSIFHHHAPSKPETLPARAASQTGVPCVKTPGIKLQVSNQENLNAHINREV